MKRKMLAILMSAVMAGGLAACSSTPQTSGTATVQQTDGGSAQPAADAAPAAEKKTPDQITIGVSFGQNVHPFFVAMQGGIEQA